ncbi:MAG: hypothetical protein MJ071_02585 [Oscillospiraceae bacterium]|nr:hypothetical protein [Oscillospiraceae bacterium]
MKKAIGIAAAVVVLAAGGTVGWAAFAYPGLIPNQIKMRTSSPEDYFHWVYDRNIEQWASGAEEAQEQQRSASEASLVVSLEPTEEGKKKLTEDDSLSLSSGFDISDMVNSCDSISLRADIANENNLANTHIALNKNDQLITELNMASVDNTQYVCIPELSSRWLGLSASADSSDPMNALNSAAALRTTDVSKSIQKYATLFTKNATNIEVDKSTPVYIGDMTVNYTALNVKTTPKQFYQTLLKLIDTIANDDTIMSMAPDPDDFSLTLSEYSEMLEEYADYMPDSLSNAIETTTYVDMTGNICGISVDLKDTISFFFAMGASKGQFGMELRMTSAKVNVVSIKANLDKSGNGSISGNIYQDSDSRLTFKINCSDMKVTNDKYLTGHMEMVVEDNDPMAIDLSSDEHVQKASYQLKFDGVNYGTLNMEFSDKSDYKFEKPDTSNAIMADENFKPADYASQDEMTAYLEKVFQRIGMADAEAKNTASSFGSLLYMMS